jgi:hypothetical protein
VRAQKKRVEKTILKFEDRLKNIFKPSGESLIGGVGDGRDIEEFDPVQVVKGIKVEMEHSNNVREVLEIVVDHLTEDPLYYDKLETIDPHH